jgi:two-component SAPR family response regulator
MRRENEVSIGQHENEHDEEKQKQSAVYIFGNFTVYNKAGIDISCRFNMKLRAFFSLLLLYTNNKMGISTEKLTSKMWPNRDNNGAKNIRGVTINRLRNILEDIGGISLVYQNSQWFFTFESSFYCDYLEYSNIRHRLYAGIEPYPELMEQLVAIVRNGKFLFGIHDTGIENSKSKEEEKMTQLLKDYIIYLYREKQYQKIILISATFFTIEPLNEEILDICMKSYNKLGKKDRAKAFLKNYKRNYKTLTGEEYKKRYRLSNTE